MGRFFQRRLVLAVSVLTLFCVMPGLGELIVDSAHYAWHGDTMHDEEHGGSDHCCSGAFHFCGCHARTVGAPVRYETVVLERTSLPTARDGYPSVRPNGGPADDHARELTRPPSA